MNASELNDLEDKTFEQLLIMLDDAVTALEANSLTLEESISAYEKSVRIVAACSERLDKAEVKITQIDSKYLQIEQSTKEELDPDYER